ncbi:MAG: sulfatase-like hydrolase/transferase, partial [Desulfobacterales bacterium]|nr:sulfatase-like hydrolase/transferase [Desulfobacterales bacterium]
MHSKRLTSLTLCLAAFFTLFSAPACAADNTKPNVIVIVADDLGYADLAFLPQAPDDIKHFGTPGLDRLASMGTYFDNAYATAPICSPARAGLITGRYQQRWGNYWYGEGGLPRSEATLPQLLKPLGYASKKIG